MGALDAARHLAWQIRNARGAAEVDDLTVAEGWEAYARRYRGSEPLGTEWNEPDELGLDVPPEEIVSYLDRALFTPFLGRVGTLLEIGPGGGRFTEALLAKCEKLIALDTSRSMLDLLERRFGREKISFVLGDGTGFTGVADASVDAAFSYGVFVHLQHWDIAAYLSELRRVLVPGGKALVQHANTLSELGWRKFLDDVPKSVNRHKPFGAFTPMTVELMRHMIEHADLEVTEIVTDLVPRDAIALIRRPR